MQYTSLVFNLLPNVFWTITPALPKGAAGTRLMVGTPEVIPEKTFIARKMTTADGFTQAKVDGLNLFIQHADAFHKLYGLNPVTVDCLDDVLKQLDVSGPKIDRVRLVTHGDNAFIFLPVFRNGFWNRGMQPAWISALTTSDENGIRITIANNPSVSPLMPDGVATITKGIRTRPGTLLAPFGLQTSGTANGPVLEYFEIVNDLFQVANGTILVDGALASIAEQNILKASLNIVEAEVRARLANTTPPGAPGTVTDTHLTKFRDGVLGATAAQLGFMGPHQNLAANVLSRIQTAVGATPQVVDDIRTAIIGSPMEPVLSDDYLDDMVKGLQLFDKSVLKMRGVVHTATIIRGDALLKKFALLAIDLHHFKNVGVRINGAAPVVAENLAIEDALTTMGDLIRDKIATRATNKIPVAQLNAFRQAIVTRPVRESAVTGGSFDIQGKVITELDAASKGMQGGFRARLNRVRARMKAADASFLDIRGCLVGATPAYLTTVRNLLGGTNKPTVTAPEWFQIFASGGVNTISGPPPVLPDIEALLASGNPSNNITGAHVAASLTAWRALIDFDPHFSFISGMFAAGAGPQRDFASLAWRAWRTTANPAGIPILRMEAAAIDDLPSLNLGQVIQRFGEIFEVAVPSATVLARLTALQPNVAGFRKTSADLAAAAPNPPTQPQLDAFLALLKAIASGVAVTTNTPPITAPATATLIDVQNFATSIQSRLDTALAADLNAFFTAVRAKVTPVNDKARLRYFLNIGLPLLLQSGSHPPSSELAVFTSAATATIAHARRAAAHRSWMRIQFTGTTAQAKAMNLVIDAVPVTNQPEMHEAGRLAMLSKTSAATSPAAINPMPVYATHIVKKP